MTVVPVMVLLGNFTHKAVVVGPPPLLLLLLLLAQLPLLHCTRTDHRYKRLLLRLMGAKAGGLAYRAERAFLKAAVR